MAYDGEYYHDDIKQILGCERCGLANYRNNIVIYRGNPRSQVMVIGEAPGADEDTQGKPMVGRSGSYLLQVLQQNGLHPKQDIYVTNTLLCRPPGNADPTPEQLVACSDWFRLQLELVKPQYIIAVGRFAAAHLIPEFNRQKMKITEIEGRRFAPPHLRGAVVIPIQHPAAILRSRTQQHQYETMIADIVSAIKNGETF